MTYGYEHQGKQCERKMKNKLYFSMACLIAAPFLATASLASEPGLRGIHLGMSYEEALDKAQELVAEMPSPEGVSVHKQEGSRKNIVTTSVFANRRGHSGNPSALVELMTGGDGKLVAITYYLDFSANLPKNRFPFVDDLRARQVASRGEPSCEQSGQFVWYQDESLNVIPNAGACMRMREVDDYLRGRRVNRDMSDLTEVDYILNVAFDPDWDFESEAMRATTYEAHLVDVERAINQ